MQQTVLCDMMRPGTAAAGCFVPPVLQLTKRYEAAVRVCQWNSGTHARPRDIGNILEKEKEIQAQLHAGGAVA